MADSSTSARRSVGTEGPKPTAVRPAREHLAALTRDGGNVEEVLSAYAAFDAAIRARPIECTTTVEDRREAANRNALAAAALVDMDLDGAVRHLAAALAADPWNQDAQANFAFSVPMLSDRTAYVAVQRALGSSQGDSSSLIRVHGSAYAHNPFQTVLAPLPLDGRRTTAFFHQPRWASHAWREVVQRYARGFTPGDDVTLVLWLDPSQGLTQEQAGQAIISTLVEAGLDAAQVPDILLVPDRLDDVGVARLYRSVDWVVPHGDARQEVRAFAAGARVLSSLAPRDWRNAAAVGRRSAIERRVSANWPSVAVIVITSGGEDPRPAIDSVLAGSYPRDALEVRSVDRSEVESAIQQTRGDYLALLHAEDRRIEGTLERQVARLEAQPDIALVYGDVVVEAAQGGVSYFSGEHLRPLRGSGLVAPLLASNFVPRSSTLVRTSLKSAFLPLPPGLAPLDWWIAQRVAATARIEMVGGPVARIREPDLTNELAFRRWVLTTPQRDAIEPADVVRAYLVFEVLARELSVGAVTVSPAQAEQAEADFRAALALSRAGQHETALLRIVQVLAQNPWHAAARTSLRSVVPELAETLG